MFYSARSLLVRGLVFACFLRVDCSAQISSTSPPEVGTIQGAVTASGKPVRNIPVTAFRLHPIDGRVALVTECKTVTADDGSYGCRELEEGKYLVVADPAVLPCGEQGCVAQRDALVPTFSPSDVTPNLSEAFPVNGNSVARKDISLQQGGLVSLSGEMPTGAALNTVCLVERRFGLVGRPTPLRPVLNETATTWRLERVPLGDYYIECSWFDGRRTRHAGTSWEAKTVARDVHLVEDTLVNGKVILPSGTTLTRAEVLRIQSLEYPFRTYQPRLYRDGTFTLQAPSGSYAADISSSHLFVDYIEEKKGTPRILQIPEAETASVRLALKENPGVVDGKTELDSLNVLFENAESGDLVLTHSVGGRFSNVRLRPGEYTLYSWPDNFSPAYRDPNIRQSIRRTGETIAIKEGHQELPDPIRTP